MATLIARKSKAGKIHYSVQVTLGDARPCIALGPVSKSQANEAKGYLDQLAAWRRSNVAMNPLVQTWLDGLDPAFYAILAERGLCDAKVNSETAELPKANSLGPFIDGYIAGRAKMKEGTIINLNRCRRVLVEYFGADRDMGSITPGDCDDFREKLRATLAENTVRRVCGRSKQFFRAAVRKKLIAESPFADMKGTSVKANRSRDYFVTRAEADAVIQACPNNQW